MNSLKFGMRSIHWVLGKFLAPDQPNPTAENQPTLTELLTENLNRTHHHFDSTRSRTFQLANRIVDEFSEGGRAVRSDINRTIRLSLGILTVFGAIYVSMYVISFRKEVSIWDAPLHLTLTLAPIFLLATGVYLIHKSHHKMPEPLFPSPNKHTLWHQKNLSTKEIQKLKPPDQNQLMVAAYAGKVAKIVQLQKQGHFLEAQDETGKTPLHWAAIGQQREVIELLWYFGCNINQLDAADRAPVHYINSEEPLQLFCRLLMHKKNRFELGSSIFLFYPPENLIIEGGGPRGIGHIGAYQALEQQGLLNELRRVAGTSAGAILAIFVALGYSSRHIQEILKHKDLKDFLDHPFKDKLGLTDLFAAFFKKDAKIKDVQNGIKNVLNWWGSSQNPQRSSFQTILKTIDQAGGICRGRRFVRWIEKYIRSKTGIVYCTFGEYRKQIAVKGFKHIYMYMIKIKSEEIFCINSEEEKWDQVVIADAVCASMSIPFIFSPSIIRIKQKETNKLTVCHALGGLSDGGAIKHLPLHYFDKLRYKTTNDPGQKRFQNRQTLALNLVEPDESSNSGSQQFGQLIQLAITTNRAFVNGEKLLLTEKPNDVHRIVSIDNPGVGLLSGFFASHETKESLIVSGQKGFASFLQCQTEIAKLHEEHNPLRFLSILQKKLGSIQKPTTLLATPLPNPSLANSGTTNHPFLRTSLNELDSTNPRGKITLPSI